MRATLPLKKQYERSLSPARQYLPAGFMEHMPFKTVSRDQLFELMCNMDYNPLYEYPKGVKTRKNEAGHDQAYRYVVK